MADAIKPAEMSNRGDEASIGFAVTWLSVALAWVLWGNKGRKNTECGRLKNEPEVRQWRRPGERVAGGRCGMEGGLFERGAV